MIAVRRDDIVVCTCALWPCGVRSRRPARPVADPRYWLEPVRVLVHPGKRTDIR